MLLFAHQSDNTPISPTFAKDSIGSSNASGICDKPILPPLSILPPPLLDFDDDNCYCMNQEEEPRRRRVCFDNFHNECHTYERVTEEEKDQVWYRTTDIAYFRWERKQWAAAILQADTDAAWSGALWRVYATLAEYASVEHVATVLAKAHIELDAHTLGLTTKLLPALHRDYALRRQHMLRILWEYNQYHNDDDDDSASNDDERAEALREAYRAVSRAPRLFAQYTAQVAAAANVVDNNQ
uniref:Uncharacterized protein n=1 Tax=Amphora coffeiformis TaxID=265554 RepID=A0A7S3L442_9STRA|mmetsp:Transcript_10221/g.19616  ORF Transcript_10221/g.19616 Transcript_10221/m.19616 type:complete len:240 (-) Transcript_10221:119-838(-)